MSDLPRYVSGEIVEALRRLERHFKTEAVLSFVFHVPGDPDAEGVITKGELSDLLEVVQRSVSRERDALAAIRQSPPATSTDTEPSPRCDTRDELDGMVVCPACSRAGGAGMPVHHLPPVCKETP